MNSMFKQFQKDRKEGVSVVPSVRKKHADSKENIRVKENHEELFARETANRIADKLFEELKN